mmetsp:Transcript_1749/g.4313  ORF Transcript_1749/g.4313 Transcript_1749/m.4313 type:complete len:252 (+) Transcript_1749:220-975(+)
MPLSSTIPGAAGRLLTRQPGPGRIPCRRPNAAGRLGLQVVASSRERRPFARPEQMNNGNSGLPTSLFMPFTGELPEDGQFLTEAEANCNEMEKFCGDPYYVYESSCHPCYGTGTVRSAVGGRARARRVLVECPHCNGLGVVRRVTTRFFPMDADGEEVLTLARKDEYRTHLARRGPGGAFSEGGPDAKKPAAKPKSNPTLTRKPPSYYKSRKKAPKGGGGNGSTPPAGGQGAGSAAPGDTPAPPRAEGARQ